MLILTEKKSEDEILKTIMKKEPSVKKTIQECLLKRAEGLCLAKANNEFLQEFIKIFKKNPDINPDIKLEKIEAIGEGDNSIDPSKAKTQKYHYHLSNLESALLEEFRKGRDRHSDQSPKEFLDHYVNDYYAECWLDSEEAELIDSYLKILLKKF